MSRMTAEAIRVSALRDQMWASMRELYPKLCEFADRPSEAPEWLVAKVFLAAAGEVCWQAGQAQETPDE